MKKVFVICFVLLIAVNCATARWLPTRGQEDRLDKLRELLKDLLETEIERSNYENKNLYKRDVRTEMENAPDAGRGDKINKAEILMQRKKLQ